MEGKDLLLLPGVSFSSRFRISDFGLMIVVDLCFFGVTMRQGEGGTMGWGDVGISGRLVNGN